MTILVLAPHADDEVLGMGGTIARRVAEGHDVVVAVLTGPGEGPHPLWPNDTWDVIRAEARNAMDALNVSRLWFRNLPAACLDHLPAYDVNAVVAELIEEVQPSELYVPFYSDLHKDHRAVSYAAAVAARPYLDRARVIERVLAYETLSETHLAPPHTAPAFEPNFFVDISSYLDKKLDAMRAYESQLQADGMPRSIASLRALATLRGAHIGAAAAEAFVLLGSYQR